MDSFFVSKVCVILSEAMNLTKELKRHLAALRLTEQYVSYLLLFKLFLDAYPSELLIYSLYINCIE